MNILLEALRSGAYREDACAAAGISYQTFLNWERKGAEQTKGQYVEFFDALKGAEAEAMVQNAEIITTAARSGDWRAAAWFLQHRRPDQWSDIAKRRQDGPDEEIRVKAQRWDKHVEDEREEKVDTAALLAANPELFNAYDAYLDAFVAARDKLQRQERDDKETAKMTFKPANE
jgi:hypothetical protein